jgi:hypothetical protein
LVGKNIQTVLENLQTDIDEVIEQKLAEYTLQNILDSVEQEIVVNC